MIFETQPRPARLAKPPALRSAPSAPVTPLSHHEILGLVEPYTRAGRHLDLPASDRAARRLQFKPLAHAACTEHPALQEVLQLECPEGGPPRLLRTLHVPGHAGMDGRPTELQAVLVATGGTPGELLARMQAVPLSRQLVVGPGYLAAKTMAFEQRTAAEPAADAPLLMSAAVAQLEAAALVLRYKQSPVKGISAEIEFDTRDGAALALPDDLLAVLGWSWARLVKRQTGWHTRLRLRGEGFKRSRDGEAKLALVLRHLAQTLAEPPARFHERLAAARWAAAARRCIPLFGAGLLVAAAWQFAKLEPDLPKESVLRLLMFHAPPIVLVALFCMNELPRVEIPPVPRRLRQPQWRLSTA
jgi:hypothetical protein